MRQRLLSAVGWIALGLGFMTGVAYALGRLTHTTWVWWLVPITFALDAAYQVRARRRGETRPLSPSGLRVFRDPGAPIDIVASVVAAVIASWGAYGESRPALVIAGAFALFGRVFERGEEPAFKRENEPA